MKRHSLTSGVNQMKSNVFQYPPPTMRQHTAPGFQGDSRHRGVGNGVFPHSPSAITFAVNGVNTMNGRNGMSGINGINGYNHRNHLNEMALGIPPQESNWVSQDSVVSNESLSSSTGESTESESQ